MKLSKDDAVKTVQGLEDAEVHVLTQKEHDELLQNFKATTIESELKSRIAKVYDDVDKDFFDATGLKKPDDQKTYKYWPTVVKKIKEESAAAAAELERIKKDGSPDLVREIESLRKAALEKDAEWKSKYDTLQSSLAVKDIKNTLDVAMRDLKLANLPKQVLDTFIESAKDKLTKTAKVVDGVVVFHDAEGNPKINKETYKPYTAEELMALELEPVIDKGTNNKGAGTEPPKYQPGSALNIPANVTDRVKLTKFLVESGMPLGTPEHKAAYDKYSANLPGI